MKRTLIVIALVAVCLYGGAWAVVASMKQRYTPRPWPENLGTLDDASKRYRDTETNAAAGALTKLLPTIDIKTIKEPLGDYYRAELERTGDQVQPPPANVAAFLAQHDVQMNAVRDHVLTAGPIRWVQHFELGHDAPIPNLLGIMSASKLFTGRALAKAASHDATSWDDLHAVWLLDRELLERPELISQLIGLAGVRMANAAAAKMPLPVPAWFGELQSFDYRHRFAGSYQAEAWMIRHARSHMTERPFFDACALDAAEEMRVWTNDLTGANRCDLSPVRSDLDRVVEPSRESGDAEPLRCLAALRPFPGGVGSDAEDPRHAPRRNAVDEDRLFGWIVDRQPGQPEVQPRHRGAGAGHQVSARVQPLRAQWRRAASVHPRRLRGHRLARPDDGGAGVGERGDREAVARSARACPRCPIALSRARDDAGSADGRPGRARTSASSSGRRAKKHRPVRSTSSSTISWSRSSTRN